MFLAGIFIVYFAAKENKVFCIVGVYFMLMGIYWLINELLPQVDLINGSPYGIIFRCVTAVVAVFTIIMYFIYHKKVMHK